MYNKILLENTCITALISRSARFLVIGVLYNQRLLTSFICFRLGAVSILLENLYVKWAWLQAWHTSSEWRSCELQVAWAWEDGLVFWHPRYLRCLALNIRLASSCCFSFLFPFFPMDFWAKERLLAVYCHRCETGQSGEHRSMAYSPRGERKLRHCTLQQTNFLSVKSINFVLLCYS